MENLIQIKLWWEVLSVLCFKELRYGVRLNDIINRSVGSAKCLADTWIIAIISLWNINLSFRERFPGALFSPDVSENIIPYKWFCILLCAIKESLGFLHICEHWKTVREG